METTLAREIYKRMEIGKEYTTRDLSRLIGDDYYKIVPVESHPNQPLGQPVSQVISEEMWKIVDSGYARTYKTNETVGHVRGLRFGTKPKSFTTYSVRYWIRTK